MLSDVTPEMQERHDEMVRKASMAQRFRAFSALFASGRRLVVAGLRLQHPRASERELQARMVARLYGREVAARYFKDLPADAT
jgi:hypothetical protein